MSISISNEKKLIGTLNKININSTNYISIGEFQKRNSEFYEVIYNNNGKEIFLGRFVKEYEKLIERILWKAFVYIGIDLALMILLGL